MRLLYVVQRYGREVAGGAELHCREFATRLAGRGHDVSVLTSCALSYVDWADHYPPGTEILDRVTVHRLPVGTRRNDRLFTPLNSRVVWGRSRPPLYLQREWILSQGPYLSDLVPWLRGHAGGYDAVIFFTYLYYPTWAGLPVAAGLVPTVLHPTAHDEPPFRLDVFETTFRHPTALAFSTEEEAGLVRRRFGVRRESAVIGIGVDLDGGRDVDVAAFRSRHGLGDRPYLLFVGRLDPAKGSEELCDFFAAYKRRRPGPLALVMIGDAVRELPAHPDVVVTGYVDEEAKRAAMAGAVALVQPSYFESFSMVLTEAWAQGKAALVQGRCAVLEGQARRSGGGIPYGGYAEFEVGVDRLIGDPALADRLGAAGRRYVEEHYEWDAVLGRYERLLDRAAAAGDVRRPAPLAGSARLPAPTLRPCPAPSAVGVAKRATTTSVVVVALKPHAWLRRCLESVLPQADQVVLVDNGSADEAVSQVGRSAGAVVERLSRNAGFAAGVNAGLRRASGDVVALLNDDAMAEPGWIESALAVLDDPSVAAVSPKILFARPYLEVFVDEEPTFAPGDARPLGRRVERVTVGGAEVGLGSLLGPGLHRLEKGSDGGVERQWRWTAGRGAIYVPVPDDAGGTDVQFDGELVGVARTLKLVNNAGSYLSTYGHGGDYGFCTPDDGAFDASAERFAATGAAMVARAETFRRIGGMAEEFFAYYEDTDWCWRARLAGMRFVYDPGGVVHHVGGVTSGGPAHEWVRLLAARNRIHTLARNAPLPVLAAEIRRRYEGRPPARQLLVPLARRVPAGLLERRVLTRNWVRTAEEVWGEWAGVGEGWPRAGRQAQAAEATG